MAEIVHRRRFEDLSVGDLHDILRLRSEVFVVEQACVYLDIDGHDRDHDTEHLWVRDELGVASCLRILAVGQGEGAIGRIVTRRDVRRSGMAGRLIGAAIDRLREAGASSVSLRAQAHLADWYRGLGFDICGDEYDEDGIPHVPMRLALR